MNQTETLADLVYSGDFSLAPHRGARISRRRFASPATLDSGEASPTLLDGEGGGHREARSNDLSQICWTEPDGVVSRASDTLKCYSQLAVLLIPCSSCVAERLLTLAVASWELAIQVRRNRRKLRDAWTIGIADILDTTAPRRQTGRCRTVYV